MSGLGEGIGAAIEGGLLARAVEPRAGEVGSHSSASSVTCAVSATGHGEYQSGENAGSGGGQHATGDGLPVSSAERE